MKVDKSLLNCQIPSLQNISEGIAEVPPQTLGRRAKMMVRRRVGPGRERAFKNYTNDRINRFCQLTGRNTKPKVSLPKSALNDLQAGDWVRVRSIEEIQTTLNHWNQVRGCAFMPEMAIYCGTTHRVLKRMKSFVDERDLLIKKSNGIILLEGVMCRGTAGFGNCDRACFHFWREEWLEKVDGPADSPPVFSAERLPAGEWVRVRSLKEIEATLEPGKQVNGCAFMPEMAEYCDTEQQALKPLRRFVDERDLRVKKASGIILLEGVMCRGADEFGNCDRTCFYLWREEWLDRAG